MRKLIAVFVIILVLSLTTTARESNANDFPWKIGEELFYKVKYTFITVGSLHFTVLGEDSIRGQKAFHCKMHLKSSNIPFLDLDDTYDSYIDADSVYAHRFWSIENHDDFRLYTLYDMDYSQNQIKITMERRYKDGGDTVQVLDSTAVIDSRIQDGLSLLYYARSVAKKSTEEDVTVFSMNQLRGTSINLTGEKDDIKVQGEKVDGYFLDGKMKFVGIAGIKEDFKGWFSEDPQSIPLHAQMKAIVGSVKVNLEWWKHWDGEKLLGDEAIRENEKKITMIELSK